VCPGARADRDDAPRTARRRIRPDAPVPQAAADRGSLFGLGVCAVGAFGTAITGASPLITPFFFLLGLGWAACFVSGTAVLADITSPRERGVLTASNDFVVAGFAAAASLSAGAMLSSAGYRAVGVLFGALLLLAVPGLVRLREVYVEAPAAELVSSPA
jgi:MFS family permease